MNPFKKDPVFFARTYALINGYAKRNGIPVIEAERIILAMIFNNKDTLETQGVNIIEWLYVGNQVLKVHYPDLYKMMSEIGNKCIELIGAGIE